MLRKILIPSMIFLFCLTMLGTVALAGTLPSPFTPQINKLNAIQNSLNSIFTVIERDLGMPPNDIEPSQNVIGAVNGLLAKENQLILLNDFLDSVMEEVLGCPPDDIKDIEPALEGVLDSSQDIADIIEAFLATPPNDIHPDFLDALEGVLGSTENFIGDTIQYIQYVEEECTMPCIEHTTQAGCESIGCVWYDVLGATGYCCNQ